MYGQNPQYGYGAPMFGYGQSPGIYGGSPGLVRPKRMVGYQEREPTTGEKLARLGLSGVAKGVGQIAGDATVDELTSYLPKPNGADALKSVSGSAGTSTTSDVGKSVGTAAGAGIGSIIPGVGTMVGGAAGGLAGGIFDMFFEKEKEPVYEAPRPAPNPRLDRYASTYAAPSRAGFYGVQNPYGFRMG